MLDSLFNTELPLLVKLAVAFAIVLVLLLAVMWIFKRFGGDRLGTSTPRGRQPRLAVIDAATIDGRRRLVLLRRDNVEHLVMIGGPSDLVIEQNIVRAVPVAAVRETSSQRPGAEATPRPASEALRGPIDALRTPAEAAPRPLRSEPPPRAPRGEPPPRRVHDLDRPRVDPVSPAQRAPLPEPRASRMPPPRIDPEAAPIEIHPAPPTADSNLASMAQKLETALRRPASPPRNPAEPAPPALSEPPPPTAPENGANAAASSTPEPPMPEPATAPERPAANAAPPSPPQAKSMFDSLEEEMASLLSRSADTPEKK